MKLKTKGIIFIILVSIIPLYFIGNFSYSLGTKIALSSEEKVVEGVLKRTKDDLQNTLNEIYYNLSYIESEYENQNLEKTIKIIKKSHKNYRNIYVNNEEANFLYQILEDKEDILKSGWYNLVKTSKKLTVIKKEKNNYILKAVRAVYKDSKFIGLIGIECNIDNIVKKINDIKVGESGYIYIIDKEGVPLIYPDNVQISISMNVKYKILENKNGKINYYWDKKEKFLIYKNIEAVNWTVLGGTYIEELKIPFKKIKLINLKVILVVVLVLVISSIFFIVMISKKTEDILKIMHNLAEGDYTNIVKIKGKDEFNYFINGMNNISEKQGKTLAIIKSEIEDIYEVSQKSEIMSEFSKESLENISINVNGLVDGISTNAAALEEATRNLDNISKKSKDVVNFSEESKNEISKTLKQAENGTGYLEEVKNVTSELKEKVLETNMSIKEFMNETNSIKNFLDLIKNISAKTNLLSVNASIEAARAGESGKGFVVVASEIKDLADKTVKITNEIESLISNILIKNREVLKSVNEEIEKVNKSEEIIKSTTDEVIKIMESFKTANEHIEKIFVSAEEQSFMISEVNIAINSINNTLHESESHTEEISLEINNEIENSKNLISISKKLEKISKKINEKISEFKIIENQEDDNKAIEEVQVESLNLFNF